MTKLDLADLRLFAHSIKRLHDSIELARLLHDTTDVRTANVKRKYPNMADDKIAYNIQLELRDKIKDVKANYNDVAMNAASCNVRFPYEIGEIISYINNCDEIQTEI